VRIPTLLIGGLTALPLFACNSAVQVESSASAETDAGAQAAPSADTDDTDEVAAPQGPAAPEGPAAPDFTLTDTEGNSHSLSSYLDQGKIVVLEWFNPECPVSRGYYSPKSLMPAVYERLGGGDLVWLAINSGALGKQGHGQKKNESARTDWNMPYPVLLDESGKVGQTYEARTTPHMYVIKGGVIAYRGAIDASNQGKPGTNYVADAVSALRAGEPVAVAETKPFGCAVKYAD
jgi:peroxiredoxin